jgi:ribonuclease T1
MALRILTRTFILIFLVGLFLQTHALAESCDKVVHELNLRLSPGIDEPELVEMLQSLNNTNNKRLPPKFVTKREARSRGWKPGRNLWSVSTLRGSSIGGDRFNNLERRLPNKKWREADLDYKGGHRGVKRLIFSPGGERFVTVDHYNTFVEVPSCR